jgi:signal transduction histidine kinase
MIRSWLKLTIKVLIVDDEPLNLDLLEALLMPEGYSLTRARNAGEALNELSLTEPDLILLDVMMPGRSGFDALADIRKNEKTRTIPVILLTSLSDRESRIRGLDAGADDFISKPFDKAELLSRVRTQAGLSILRRQINEKEKLSNVMELMGEGSAITDSNFNLTLINNAAAEMLGIKGSSGNFRSLLEERFARVPDFNVSGGRFILERLESAAHNASFLSSEYRGASGPGGAADSYVFIFKDVTGEYGRNKMKADFLSLISHKLRTPLTVISGYAKMLGIMIPDPGQKGILDDIKRNSAIMENLINRILYFVEIENTYMDGAANVLNLREAIARFSGDYGKPYELIYTGPASVPFWMKIAAEELISNAFKFSDKGKLVLKVTTADGGLTIYDNGPGIPPEEREKVFEPFYQVYKNFSGNIAGAGLGLSIVRKLCELNGFSVKLGAGVGGGLNAVITMKTNK